MDDEAENRLLVDAFFSNLRLFTQATQSAWNRCTILGYIKHFCRVCLLKNECLIAIVVVIAVIFLLQYGRLFGRRFGVFFPHSGIRLPPSPVDEGKQKSTRSAASRIGTATAAAFRAAAASFVVGPEEEKIVIEERGNIGAAYAVQGRRGTMEDRFIIRENIGGSDVHLFAVFDGHGGSFSADFAKSRLLNKLEKEIAAHPEKYSAKGTNGNGNSGDGTATADCMRNSVNLVKLIKAEIAATDKELIKEAINAGSPSGTTALIALQNDEFLVVGNVGDSRGVMCCNTSEGKQNPVPLSYDHKPDQEKEKKRIEEAGGWIAFNGVWRVQGILAVSRALGDTLFKGRNIVTSEPDVLCFPLNGSLDPQFYILASDGLWDVFTNEGAMRFAHERFSKNDDAGAVAKALVMEGMTRGTMDNVCVVSVRLPPRDRKNLPSRRKSLSSPTLARKASITKRVVSSDELERRNSGIIPDNVNVEIKYALKTVSEDDDASDQPK